MATDDGNRRAAALESVRGQRTASCKVGGTAQNSARDIRRTSCRMTGVTGGSIMNCDSETHRAYRCATVTKPSEWRTDLAFSDYTRNSWDSGGTFSAKKNSLQY